MTHFLQFDNKMLWDFEKAREDAQTAGADVFEFNGHMVSTPYAGYIIEIVKRHFARKKMAGSGDVEGFEDIMAEHKFTRLEAVIWKFQKDYYGYSDDVFPVKDLAQYIQTHVQDVQA